MNEYIQRIKELTAEIDKIVDDIDKQQKKANEWFRITNIQTILTDLQIEIDALETNHKNNEILEK
jgi:hypothetical protein